MSRAVQKFTEDQVCNANQSQVGQDGREPSRHEPANWNHVNWVHMNGIT
jgi:hypothetical protein